jgi:hypothetical protein
MHVVVGAYARRNKVLPEDLSAIQAVMLDNLRASREKGEEQQTLIKSSSPGDCDQPVKRCLLWFEPVQVAPVEETCGRCMAVMEECMPQLFRNNYSRAGCLLLWQGSAGSQYCCKSTPAARSVSCPVPPAARSVSCPVPG